jgi:hypothetical protein
MSEPLSPMVVPGDREVAQLRQITVRADDEVAEVNGLLRDGWRLLSIGFQPSATVYVLARSEDKPRHRAGFIGND